MKHSPYSFSKLKRYRDCPLSFRYRYIDRYPEPEFEYLTSGKILHRFSELYDRDVIEHGQEIAYYNRRDTLSEAAGRFPITPDIQALADEYVAGRELDTTNLVGVEEWITLGRKLDKVVSRSTCFMRGIIDRLYIKGAVARVVDLKTGRKMADPWQLKIYAWLVMNAYPQITEVEGVFDYLRYPGLNQRHQYRRSELDLVTDEILRLVDIIEADEKFLPRVTTTCDTCGHWMRCPKMNTNSDGLYRFPMTELEFDQLVADHIAAKKLSKETRAAIKTRVELHGDGEARGFHFSLQPETRTVLDEPATYELIKMLGKCGVDWSTMITLDVKKAAALGIPDVDAYIRREGILKTRMTLKQKKR